MLVSLVVEGGAQQRPAVPAPNDPRALGQAGFKDAGEAARNMERIATMPKPDGFLIRSSPGRADAAGTGSQPAGTGPDAPLDPRSRHAELANSDLAFSGNHLFMGNFNGFNTYDVERPGNRSSGVGGVSGGQGGPVGARQSADHVGGADARRIDAGQGIQEKSAPSGSAASGSSTSPT